ncbi:Transmembrane protein [Balamuthia mandrillaris]
MRHVLCCLVVVALACGVGGTGCLPDWTELSFIEAAKFCFTSCDVWRFRPSLYCGCIASLVYPCMSIVAPSFINNKTVPEELHASLFVTRCASVCGELCYKIDDEGTEESETVTLPTRFEARASALSLPSFFDSLDQLETAWSKSCPSCPGGQSEGNLVPQSRSSWLVEFPAGVNYGLCACVRGYGGPDCKYELDVTTDCQYVGGCINITQFDTIYSTAELCAPYKACDDSSGVCYRDGLRSICPAKLLPVDPQECYTLDCYIDAYRECTPRTPNKCPRCDDTQQSFRCWDGSCQLNLLDCRPPPSSRFILASEGFIEALQDTNAPRWEFEFPDAQDPNESLGGVEVPPEAFGESVFLRMRPVSVKKIYELFRERFVEEVMSSMVSLKAFRAVADEEEYGHDFGAPVRIRLRAQLPVNASVIDACLSFLDESNQTNPQWVCLNDSRVLSLDPLVFTATTTHFTDFAVLLGESPDGDGDGDGEDGAGAEDDAEEKDDGGEDNMAPIVGGVVGGVAFIGIVVVASLVVLWFVRGKMEMAGSSNASVVNFDGEE